MEEKIKNWLVKDTALTPQDKMDIVAATKSAGIRHTFRTGCPDCYRDAVIALAAHYGVRLSEPKATASGRWQYLLPRPTMWNGVVRLDQCSDDATIEAFRRAMPHDFAKFFKKV